MMNNKKNLLATVLLAVLFLMCPVTADTLAINGGDGQSATVNTAVTTAPSVIVKDTSNAPVSGASVTFTVATGGGSVTDATVTTGADGIATVGSWTLGTTAGSNTLTVTSGSLTSVTITATGTAGPAAALVINAGNGQTATAGTAVATPPSVIVKDAYNNPVNNAPVIFTPASGSGTVSGGSTTTGSNGIASVGSWTLGSTAGTNTLTASSGSLTSVSFSATGTSALSSPVITSVSPTSATNSGSQTIDITGSGFSGSTVTLTKTGQSTITGTVTGTDTTTTLSRNFYLNGISAGEWTLVVTNSDGGTKSTSFTINSASSGTVTSVSPTSGTVNTTVATTITGTGFTATTAKIRLYLNSNYIGGYVNSGGSATQLTGSFNLNLATPATYSVCVLADGTEASKVCGPTFTVLSSANQNGSIYITSSPSGAVVYVDYIQKGNTPLTVYNVTPGSHTIKLQRAMYNDWADQVTIAAGNQSQVSATMKAIDTSTTVQTTAPVVITTATLPPTKVKSTVKTPTPWPTATATTASPVEPVFIIGGVCLAMLVLRRH